MEASVGEAGGHFATVGDILGASTPADHADIIKKGLGSRPSDDTRAQALAYANEHLTEGPELIDIQLTVAEMAMQGIKPDPQLGWDGTRYSRTFNTEGINEALGILKDIANTQADLGEEAYGRALSLIGRIGDLQPIREYEVVGEEYEAAGPFAEPITEGGSSPLVAGIRDVDITTQDSERLRAETVGLLTYKRGIAALSAQFIERAIDELPNPVPVLGRPVHRAYLDLASWTITKGFRGTNHNNDTVLTPTQLISDMLVSRALEHVDVHTPDAVEVYLEIGSDRYLNYPQQKGEMFKKAVEVTHASSREPDVSYVRSVFGMKREERSESPFERRRALLTERITSSFYDALRERPETISALMTLYEPDEAMQLWQNFGSWVAGRSFTNGHYSPSAIKSVGADLELLRRVAPEPVVDAAEKRIRERLASSSVS